MMPKRLNIMELHRTINEKNEKKKECYQKILEICHKKITIASESKKLKHIFDVPEYLIGYPLFDLNSCITFIIDSLKINGFLVKYYFPKTLYVSWDFDEIKIEAQENKQIYYKPTQNNKLLSYNEEKQKENEQEDYDKNLFNIKKTSKEFLKSSLQKSENIHSLNFKKNTGKLELNLY